ncbi:hypothetical protein [Oricola sp.]|uniref:hypothetical protein n=1 Tax=Oricola sp. TaxID=1979950 RepID=UPI003BA984A4
MRIILMAIALLLTACAPQVQIDCPNVDRTLVSEGRAVFRKSCEKCHDTAEMRDWLETVPECEAESELTVFLPLHRSTATSDMAAPLTAFFHSL